MKLLKEKEGFKYVLNSEAAAFKAELLQLIAELQPTYFVDYLAGNLAAEILQMLPYASELLQAGMITN